MADHICFYDRCGVCVKRPLEARLAEVEAKRALWFGENSRAQDELANLRIRLAEVEAERDTWRTGYHNAEAATRRAETRLAEVEAERDRAREDAAADGRLITAALKQAEAAEARLADVLALCDDDDPEMTFAEWQSRVRAAAAGDRADAAAWCGLSPAERCVNCGKTLAEHVRPRGVSCHEREEGDPA